MGAMAPEHGIYTHYTRLGATRLDTIYVTRKMSGRYYGSETLVTAFTDNPALVLHTALNMPLYTVVADAGKCTHHFYGIHFFRTSNNNIG